MIILALFLTVIIIGIIIIINEDHLFPYIGVPTFVFGCAGILYCVVAICCNSELELHFPERYTELVTNIQTYENSEDKDMLTRINLYNEAKHVNSTITKIVSVVSLHSMEYYIQRKSAIINYLNWTI